MNESLRWKLCLGCLLVAALEAPTTSLLVLEDLDGPYASADAVALAPAFARTQTIDIGRSIAQLRSVDPGSSIEARSVDTGSSLEAASAVAFDGPTLTAGLPLYALNGFTLRFSSPSKPVENERDLDRTGRASGHVQ